MDSEYIYYYLKGSKKLAESLASGTTFAELSGSRFAQLPIPIAPSDEQKRIVSKIEELFSDLDKGEESLRQAQRLLATYRQAVLKAAVTGELTRDWREANAPRLESGAALLQRILQARREQWQGRGPYAEPQAPDTRSLPALPEGWVWASVDHLLIQPLKNGRSVPDSENGFPVLRLTSVKESRIDLSERKLGLWTREDAADYLVYRGDFLVVRGNGSKNLVGRGGLVVDEPDLVAYPDTLIRMRVNQGWCSRGYLSVVWSSWLMRSQIESRARTTAGIYKINQQDISSFVVPLAPIEEQEEIVQRINDVFSPIAALETWCATELTRSATLRQSILKAAFSGHLVPQDPTDEPAGELLARIRGGCAPQPAVPTERRGRTEQLTLWEPA